MISPKSFAPPVPEALEEPEPSSDRPTLLPEFDPEEFARDSELRLRTAQSATGETTTDEARRLLDEGKPEQALFLLARLLEQAPLHAEARTLSQACSAALERDCLSAVGSGSAVLEVAVSPDELMGFGLDHVSGFLLSLMDGRTSVETLLDLCGVSRLLALRHLRDLVTRGIVRVRPRTT